MENVNVEEIMEEIRKEIQEKNYRKEELDFEDIEADEKLGEGCYFQMDELQLQLDNLSTHWHNPVYFPLPGNPIKVFFQRVFRRLLLFVIFPAFQFQNRFNNGTVNCLKQVEFYIQESAELKKRTADQQSQLEECQKQIQLLKEEVRNLKELINK